MKIDFVKLHGLGNDFIFIEDFKGNIELTAEQVARICDRHFGVGADGIILVRSSPKEECAAYMHYINSDGSLAEMCGNGVRCFAKYLVDRQYVDPLSGSFTADTLAGSRSIAFEVDEHNLLSVATVDMGEPILDPAGIPVDAQPNAQTDQGIPCVEELPLESPWGTFRFTCVSMGNPHAVCFIDSFGDMSNDVFNNTSEKSLETLNVDSVGSYFESNAVFPQKTNVEFACVNNDGISMRVFERGCGETLACGTGACATNVAGALTKRTGRENDLFLLGGVLHIAWAANNHVLMSGPAQESFVGSLDVEDL